MWFLQKTAYTQGFCWVENLSDSQGPFHQIFKGFQATVKGSRKITAHNKKTNNCCTHTTIVCLAMWQLWLLLQWKLTAAPPPQLMRVVYTLLCSQIGSGYSHDDICRGYQKTRYSHDEIFLQLFIIFFLLSGSTNI